MALDWRDTFDTYSSIVDVEAVWTKAGTSFTFSAGGGEGGSNGIIGSGSGGSYLTRNMSTVQAFGTIGMKIKFNSNSGAETILQVLDSGGGASWSLDRAGISPNIALKIYSGDRIFGGAVLLATGAINNMVLNTWYNIECHYTVGNGNGNFACQINGVSDSNLTLTNVVLFGANTSVSKVRLSGVNLFTDTVDDVYVANTTNNSDYVYFPGSDPAPPTPTVSRKYSPTRLIRNPYIIK